MTKPQGVSHLVHRHPLDGFVHVVHRHGLGRTQLSAGRENRPDEHALHGELAAERRHLTPLRERLELARGDREHLLDRGRRAHLEAPRIPEIQNRVPLDEDVRIQDLPRTRVGHGGADRAVALRIGHVPANRSVA